MLPRAWARPVTPAWRSTCSRARAAARQSASRMCPRIKPDGRRAVVQISGAVGSIKKPNPITQPERVGDGGFCFGGGVTLEHATKCPSCARRSLLRAHPRLRCKGYPGAVLAIYGGLDGRINADTRYRRGDEGHKQIFEKWSTRMPITLSITTRVRRYHAESARECLDRRGWPGSRRISKLNDRGAFVIANAPRSFEIMPPGGSKPNKHFFIRTVIVKFLLR